MSLTKYEIMKRILNFLRNLVAYTPNEEPIRRPKATPKPVDPWATLKEQLPEKLAWAASVDVAALAEQANASPETVEREAGFPGSWLKLGAFLEAAGRASLEDMLKLAQELQGDSWQWFAAYAKSPAGYGPVTLSEFMSLKDTSIGAFGKLFGLDRFVAETLKTVTELHDFYRFAHRLGGRYHEVSDKVAEMLYAKKEEILSAKRDACVTEDDRARFYRTIPGCPPNAPSWLCACKMRQGLAWQLKTDVETRIHCARTSDEAKSVIVPHGITELRRNLTEEMQAKKDRRVSELLAQEEASRVRQALAAAQP